MFQSVLVPADLSHRERIMPMLNQADELCASDGTISIVHILPAIPGYVAAELPGGFEEKNILSAQEELAEIARKAVIDAQIIVRSGATAAHACLEIAKETEADLIVIASHDPGFADYFLGSTAARIVRHAHCAVFVLR